MNLCGGITSFTEEDLFLQIPDEEFSLTPRRKKVSSTPSRRSSSKSALDDATSSLRTLQTADTTNNPPSRSTSREEARSTTPSSARGLLNPVSIDDLKKMRSRQRNSVHPLRGMKSSSILMKKLESGFNLAWVNGNVKGQTVNLSTNSDKTYLRIRMRSRDEDDNENDGCKSNQGDIRLKVRHIARVGSDKEENTEQESQTDANKSTSYFIIKMKQAVDKWSKFKFVAESLAERDTVVLAVRSLMSQGKANVEGSFRTSSSLRDKIRNEERQDTDLSSRSERKTEVREDVSQSDKALFFDFDMQKNRTLKGEEKGNSNRSSRTVSNHKKSLLEVSDVVGEDKQSLIDTTFAPGNRESTGGANDSTALAGSLIVTPGDNMSKTENNVPSKISAADPDVIRSRALLDKQDLKTSGSQAKNNFSSKIQIKNDRRRIRTQKRSDLGRKISVERKKFTMDEVKDSLLYETFGCNVMGCHTQALAAVEDGDLANFATNQLSGPWCTDDVCTVSLTDFADSMKGIFDLKENSEDSDYSTGQKQKTMAEEYIAGFLSNKNTMSELLSVKDLFTIAETEQLPRNRLKRKQIRNRANKPDGKATRLRSLREHMSFEAATKTKKMTFVQTTNSFDDINRCGKWERRSYSKYLQVAGQLDSSTYLDREDIQEKDGDEILYYDSDPEDARERSLKRGHRRAMAERENLVKDDMKSLRREALDILGTSRFGLGRKWRRLGEDVVLDIIEATKHEKLTLMWHPTQTRGNNEGPTAICVNLWVEAGVYLVDGTFLLPKLTWLPANETNLFARVLNMSEESPGSLDLLDVCRVKECETIDRNLYPFAITERSFVIQTQNGKHIFETRSTQERARIVNGLKLVIARLASLLMLRDLRAVDEFFGGNNSVPGDAPAWARTEKNDSSSDFPSVP